MRQLNSAAAQPHLAGAPDGGEVVFERLVDVIHELAQLGQPAVFDGRDVALRGAQRGLLRAQRSLDGVDLRLALLELRDVAAQVEFVKAKF